MYSRKVGDRTLTFGVSGMLKENALIMFDEETKSVWSHITGEALGGPLKGERLKRIASLPRISWRQVRAEYPEAKVLQVDGAVDAPTSRYAGYHAGEEVGVAEMETAPDRRLPPKALVAGVTIDGRSKAYPHDLLDRKRVLNDTVGDTPVVVARVAAAQAVVIFDRRVGGRALTFDPPTPDGRMRDRQTGTSWSALRGRALEGPLRGQSLTRLPHIDMYMYWFGWHAYHPQTTVHGE